MKAILIPLILAISFLGCASGGSDGEEVLPVPVYAEGDAPCEYEIIRRIEARGYLHNPRDYLKIRDVELGKMGAQSGADAVIVADGPVKLPFVVGDPELARRGSTASTTFYGEAVRFKKETCGR